jgi:hypothetical protein
MLNQSSDKLSLLKKNLQDYCKEFMKEDDNVIRNELLSKFSNRLQLFCYKIRQEMIWFNTRNNIKNCLVCACHLYKLQINTDSLKRSQCQILNY